MFIEKAAKIYWAFKDGRKPEVTGASAYYESSSKSINDGNRILASTKTWAILDGWACGFADSYQKTSFVRMGNVMYPIDFEPFDDLELTEVQEQDLNSLRRVNFLIEMPLGSVSIDPGREALDYDQMTMENIFEALRKAMKNFRSTILDKARKHLSPFEGLTLYQESMRSLSGSYRGEETLRFKGQTWKFHNGNMIIDTTPDVRVLEVISSRRSNSGFSIRKKESPLVGKTVVSLSKSSIFIVAKSAKQVISSYTMEKVKKAFIENVFETRWSNVSQVVLVNGNDVLESIGDPINEVYSFEDLPSPEAPTASVAGVQTWSFYMEQLDNPKETLTLYTVMKSRGYHTVIDGKLVKGRTNEDFQAEVKRALSVLKELGYNTEVKIIPYPMWKEMGKTPKGWMTPFEALKGKLEDERVVLNERILKSHQTSGITDKLDFFKVYSTNQLNKNTYKEGSLFKEMLDLYMAANKEKDPDSNLYYKIQKGINLVSSYYPDSREDLLKIINIDKTNINDKGLYQVYPMLEAVEYSGRWRSNLGSTPIIQAIKDYVNMVDSHL